MATPTPVPVPVPDPAPAASQDEPPLHTQILSTPAISQNSSPLFGLIPAEVRAHIFELALADFPDPEHYDPKTCYTRPSYLAPRKSDVRLLRTCRAIYSETWFLPFLLREQIHWVTEYSRAPPGYDYLLNTVLLHNTLDQISKQRGGDELEIDSLRMFAQMFMLEKGSLRNLFGSPLLRPRRLTLTIRHADWWWWEQDEGLRFEANWIGSFCRMLPSSVQELRIELESLERKKEQVDYMAKNMCERWFFKRTDGAALYPDASGRSIEVDRWSGTSTWHGKTWTRDETKPDQIDYYVATVVFQPMHVIERQRGTLSEMSLLASETNDFSPFRMRLQWPKPGEASEPWPYTSVPATWDQVWDVLHGEENVTDDDDDEDGDEDDDDDDDVLPDEEQPMPVG